MDVRFEYKFHGHGLSVGEGEVKEGHVWLDVGNALRAGVIDHHHLSGDDRPRYTVEVLCDEGNRHLIDSLVDELKSADKDTAIVHTHEHPDTDALFSIYLLRYYIGNGEFPPNLDAILEYVSQIDSEDIKIKDTSATLYKVICCLAEKYRDSANIEKCLKLIGMAIDKNHQSGFSFMEGDILEGLDEYNAEKERILNDENCYKSDKADKNICDEVDVDLPVGESGIIFREPAKALVWKKRPTCEFNRLWARSEGYVVTVIPQEDKIYVKGGRNIVCTDTIISIPPDVCDRAGNKYSLKELAYLLERYEQYREAAVFGDKNNKRDHSRPRGVSNAGDNRFFKKPWSVTSDPWYFTDDNTLVQSPRTGSLLTTEEVIKIVETFGKCYVKEHRMKVLVPFTFNPLGYSNVKKRFKHEGWEKVESCNTATANSEACLPWMKKSAYISTFIEEYKSLGNEGRGHFVILKNSLPDKIVSAVEKCNVHIKEDCTFNKKGYQFNKESCYMVLFQYGIGIVILEQEPFNSDFGKRFVSSEIDLLNVRQNTLHEHFIEHPIFESGPEKLSFLAPHFYTSVEVSSECLNMSDSLISRYAEYVCDVFNNRAGFATVEKIGDRTILASSRKGVAMVIATVGGGEDNKNNLNKSEYAYQKRFSEEWFFMYLITLQQKYSLIEIKRSFASQLGMNARKETNVDVSGDTKGLWESLKGLWGKLRGLWGKLIEFFATHMGMNTNKGAKGLREMLIEFYATSYFTTATDDQLGDNIYCKWHEGLMIKDIRTDIMEQINRHDEYISEKLTAIFNKISNWLIPLAVASTIIQVSVNAKTILETLESKVLKGLGGTAVEWLTALVALSGPITIVMLGAAALIIWRRLKKKRRNS